MFKLLCNRPPVLSGTRHRGISSYVPQLQLLLKSSRDLYDENQMFVTGTESTKLVNQRTLSELTYRERRSIRFVGNKGLREYLEQTTYTKTKLHRRLQTLLGDESSLSNKEAMSVLCGPANSNVKFEKDGYEEIYNSWQLAKIGKCVYNLTKDTLLIFSDVQHLSTPSDELDELLQQISDDASVIPAFMENHLIYDYLIPFRGTKNPITTRTARAARRTQIRNATSISSFFTLIGLLTMKYGKEHTVESFLVPKVFNGNSGIIQTITDKLNTR